MRRIIAVCLLGGYLCASGGAQQIPSVKDFLEGLIQTPEKFPEHTKAVGIVNQITPMSRAEVLEILPLIFEGLSYQQEAVKLHAALALYMVSIRPDSYVLLEPKLKDILALLESGDNRLMMTVPAVVESTNIPQRSGVAGLLEFRFG